MRNVFEHYQRWTATRLKFIQQPRYLEKQFPPRVVEAAPISGLGKTLTRKAAGQYVYRRQIVTWNGKRAYVVLHHWDMRKSVAERGASEPIVVIGPTDRKPGVDQPRSQPTHTAEQAAGGQRAPRRPREAALVDDRCVPPVSVGSMGRCIALGHQGEPAHSEASVRACQQALLSTIRGFYGCAQGAGTHPAEGRPHRRRRRVMREAVERHDPARPSRGRTGSRTEAGRARCGRRYSVAWKAGSMR